MRRLKGISIVIAIMIICLIITTGCASKKLSSDFDREEIEVAAENVIMLLNNKDTEGIYEISTVQMKKELVGEVLEEVYEMVEEGGKFKEIEKISIAGRVSKTSKEEFAVTTVRTKYENKNITFTVSWTKQMKLIGLFLK